MNHRHTKGDVLRLASLAPFLCLIGVAAQTGTLFLCASAVALAPPADPSDSPEEASPPSQVSPKDDPVVLVEGQVTNYVGGGHAGVSVTVALKDEHGQAGQIVASAVTDALGDFVVKASDRVEGDVLVKFTAPQYAELVRELHLEESEYPPFLAETLDGKHVIIGRVVDALTDKPLSHAEVELKAEYKEWFATADEEGQFTIERVVPGSGVLVIEADGYGRERIEIDALEDFGEIVAKLKPERVVTIQIRNAAGESIPGVIVECLDEDQGDLSSGVTDQDGSLILHGLRFDTRELEVRLTHDDYVSDGEFGRFVILPSDTRVSSHVLTMVRAGLVSGSVTNQTGQSLYGARVMTGEVFTDDSPRDWTDYEGVYAIHGVPPGRVMLTVHLSGYAPELKTVQVTEGKTARLDIKLNKGVTVSGRVCNQDGEPVVGAFVDATQWRGFETLGLRTVTGADGRFEIEHAPNEMFHLSVMACGFRPLVNVKWDPAREEPFVVTLEKRPDRSDVAGMKVGDTAPAVTVTTLDGERIDLANLRGKTVLLDFWATWCGPCVADVPQLKKVYKQFGSRKDFVMIGISLDGDEKTLRRFLKKKEIPWPQVFGASGGAELAKTRFGVLGIPAVFIVDPLGKIAGANVSIEALLEKIKRILEDNDPT